MASPQLENGYTTIANELLEAFVRYKFPKGASVPARIFIFVVRKTYGYHKKMDRISLTQFQEGIGESNRSNLVHWLKFLVQAKILLRHEVSKNSIEYGINKNYDDWLPLVQAMKLVQARAWGGASTDTKTSASTDTHKRKKEKTKEISKTSVLQGKQWNELIDLFETINPMYQDFYKNKTERNALESMVARLGFEKVKSTIEHLPEIIALPFAPKVTKPSELKRDLGKLIAFYNQEKSKLQTKGKAIIQA